MSNRLEQAIEKVIYWGNAYQHSRDKFLETSDLRYANKMEMNRVHVLSSAEWLKKVYEEETGKKVTRIGKLPEVEELNERE